MIPSPSALSAAKQVLLTGEELFLAACEAGFAQPQGLASLAPEMTALFARSAAETDSIIFQNLISSGGSAIESSAVEAAAESLAVSSERAGLSAIAEGGATTIAGNAGASLTRTLLESAGRGVIIGLLLSVTEYAINRVKRWQTQITVSRAHTAISATLTGILLDVFRDSNPDLNPWPEPWAKPATENDPVTEDEQRRKRNRVKRYRRMQRTRRK